MNIFENPSPGLQIFQTLSENEGVVCDDVA